MAKYDKVGSVYKKRDESVWPGIIGAVLIFVSLAFIFG